MKTRLLLLIFILALAGCQAGDDVAGTMEADEIRYATESVELANAALLRNTEVAATADAAEIQIAENRNVNNQIFATLAASSTATPVLLAGQVADIRRDALAASDEFDFDDRLFIKTGVSDTIDTSSGCVVNPRTSYTTDTQRLYATVQAYNVQAGTPMRANWYREDEMVKSEDWFIDQSRAEYCIWFSMDQTEVQFTPGSWMVILYVDEENFQLEDPMAFFFSEP